MSNNYDGYEVGDRVVHTRFGTAGTVLEVCSGDEGYVYVMFDNGTSSNYGFFNRPISEISLLV